MISPVLAVTLTDVALIAPLIRALAPRLTLPPAVSVIDPKTDVTVEPITILAVFAALNDMLPPAVTKPLIVSVPTELKDTVPKFAVIVPVDACVIVPELAVVTTEIAVPPEVNAPFNTILSAALKVTVPKVEVIVSPVLTVKIPALVADVKDTFKLPVTLPPRFK
jgi:hypothetical protein